jgi:hypothetical protein
MLSLARVPFARLATAIIVFCASALIVGCPPSDKTRLTEPAATCAKAGDTCTFSPGKLGVCVQPVESSASLVCQSLH